MKLNESIPQVPSVSKLLQMAGPVMLSQATIFMCGIIDLIFIRHYGSVAIGAVSISNVIAVTLLNFMEGLGTTTTVMVSKSRAENNNEDAGRLLSLALMLALGIGALFFISASSLSHWVFHSVVDKSYAVYGQGYLFYEFSGFSVFLVFMVLAGYFRGIQDTRTPLKATLLIGLMNILLDALLIKGWGIFPGLGVPGSALATCLSYLSGVMYLAFKLNRLHHREGTSLKNPKPGPWRQFLRMGSEVGFYTGTLNIAMCLFIGFIKQLGPDSLAAHQVSFQIFLLTYLPATGFLVSATILIPALETTGKPELVREGIGQILKLSVLVGFVISLVLESTAPLIARFFLPGNPDAVQLALQALRIVGMTPLFSSIYMVLRGALTGLRDTRYIALEGLASSYLVFIPLTFLFTVVLKWGLTGGYLAFMSWILADFILLGSRTWWRVYKK